MADERPLLTELCAYREVLCVLHVQRTWSVEEDPGHQRFRSRGEALDRARVLGADPDFPY